MPGTGMPKYVRLSRVLINLLITYFKHARYIPRTVLDKNTNMLYFPSLEQAAVQLLKRNSTPISRRKSYVPLFALLS